MHASSVRPRTYCRGTCIAFGLDGSGCGSSFSQTLRLVQFYIECGSRWRSQRAAATAGRIWEEVRQQFIHEICLSFLTAGRVCVNTPRARVRAFVCVCAGSWKQLQPLPSLLDRSWGKWPRAVSLRRRCWGCVFRKCSKGFIIRFSRQYRIHGWET